MDLGGSSSITSGNYSQSSLPRMDSSGAISMVNGGKSKEKTLTPLKVSSLTKKGVRQRDTLLRSHPRLKVSPNGDLVIRQNSGMLYLPLRKQWLTGYLDTSGHTGVRSPFQEKRAITAHVVKSRGSSIVSIIAGSKPFILLSSTETDTEGSTYTLLGISTNNQRQMFVGSFGNPKSGGVKYARSRKKAVRLNT